MAVTDGVVGAVIPNADSALLPSIAHQRKELTERARSGRLKPSDVANGTFTITNLGMYNIDAFNAIILPPQAAILAVGRYRRPARLRSISKNASISAASIDTASRARVNRWESRAWVQCCVSISTT